MTGKAGSIAINDEDEDEQPINKHSLISILDTDPPIRETHPLHDDESSVLGGGGEASIRLSSRGSISILDTTDADPHIRHSRESSVSGGGDELKVEPTGGVVKWSCSRCTFENGSEWEPFCEMCGAAALPGGEECEERDERREKRADEEYNFLSEGEMMEILRAGEESFQSKEYECAYEIFARALGVSEMMNGCDHRVTLMIKFRCACSLHFCGQLEAARRVYQLTLEEQMKVLGEVDGDTLQTMNNLSVILLTLGEVISARKMCMETLKGYTHLHGPNHFLTENVKGLLQKIERRLDNTCEQCRGSHCSVSHRDPAYARRETESTCFAKDAKKKLVMYVCTAPGCAKVVYACSLLTLPIPIPLPLNEWCMI